MEMAAPPDLPGRGCSFRIDPRRRACPVALNPSERADLDHLIPLILMAVVVGLSKGGLASAAALAVPFLALFMNPVQAAAILLPVFLVTDWAAVWLYRRDFSGRNLAILIPGMILGTGLATLLTPVLPESGLLLATGLIGMWYVGRSWLARGRAEATPAAVAPGIFLGVLTGIASFITHSGSPPAQAYLMPQKLPKLRFAGTTAIAFAAGNVAKLRLLGARDPRRSQLELDRCSGDGGNGWRGDRTMDHRPAGADDLCADH